MQAESQHSPSTQVTALILAGGQSSRMGTDKALLPWQGMPFIQRVVEVAQECCGTVRIATPWPERYRHLVSNSIDWCLEDSGNAGPLVALARGSETVQTPWVLLLACDMPQLNPQVLSDWIAQLPAQDSDSTAIAYVPHYQSRWEPLCGLYKVAGLPSLDAFIAEGGRSFQVWLNRIGAVPLEVENAIASMLYNCNTPEDLNFFNSNSIKDK
jgi:molybdenum cofactor guanylyltransferase